MTAINGSRLISAAPLDPMVPEKPREPQHGIWHPNSYTALRDTLIGPTTDDGDLFPSGWTPEAEERA